jgi:hypothetical protein
LTITDQNKPAVLGKADTSNPQMPIPVNDVITATMTGPGSYLINGSPASKTPPWRVDVSNKQWAFSTTGCYPQLFITVVGQ